MKRFTKEFLKFENSLPKWVKIKREVAGSDFYYDVTICDWNNKKYLFSKICGLKCKVRYVALNKLINVSDYVVCGAPHFNLLFKIP